MSKYCIAMEWIHSFSKDFLVEANSLEEAKEKVLDYFQDNWPDDHDHGVASDHFSRFDIDVAVDLEIHQNYDISNAEEIE